MQTWLQSCRRHLECCGELEKISSLSCSLLEGPVRILSRTHQPVFSLQNSLRNRVQSEKARRKVTWLPFLCLMSYPELVCQAPLSVFVCLCVRVLCEVKRKDFIGGGRSSSESVKSSPTSSHILWPAQHHTPSSNSIVFGNFRGLYPSLSIHTFLFLRTSKS